VHEIHFDGLPVQLAHLLDASFINMLLSFRVLVSAQEGRELFADELDYFWLLNPGGEVFLLV
jgi:hypothetical protein